MKKAFKFLKMLLFICLIVLACLGVGLSGGIPIPMNRFNRHPEKNKIELMEKNDEKDASKTKE